MSLGWGGKLAHRAYLLRQGGYDRALNASVALQRLLSKFQFESVLDVGCGAGQHAERFLAAGKSVTAIDYGDSHYFRKNSGRVSTRIGDFMEMEFEAPFDCVWASHVLEHQENAQDFLEKIVAVTREGGVIAVTVPPSKHFIVGGHVSLWNGGLLLYRMVLAGLDCREARILRYGYNISLLLEKRTVELPSLEHDAGDIRRLRHLFPPTLQFKPNAVDDPFDGNIWRLNWWS